MSSSISISKKWLAFYLLAAVLAAGTGWLYTSQLEPETRFWTQVFKTRRAELTSRTAEPHILFTGDSACSFSIDAPLFTQTTGIPSFNLGGTRQMGLTVFMTEALSQARKGDTIILICNPDLLTTPPDTRLTKAGAQMHLALGRQLSPTDRVSATRPGFNHLIVHAAKLALGKPSFTYQMKDYRTGGLVTTNRRDHPPGEKLPFSTITTAVQDTLLHWIKKCHAQGVQLRYLLPLELTASEQLEANRKLKTEFLRALPSILDTKETFILPTPFQACSSDEELFSDTLFHLTEDGAAHFTRLLASQYKKDKSDLRNLQIPQRP